MISSTLGAPFGGTTVGGQYGLDCSAPRLISPPNFGGGLGRYFPSIVVVALGDPGVPVICCACGEPNAQKVRNSIGTYSAGIFIRASISIGLTHGFLSELKKS